MENTKNILLKFKKDDNKIYGITIKHAKDEVKDEDVKKLMQGILDKNIIKDDVVKLAAIKGATLVETHKKNFDLK